MSVPTQSSPITRGAGQGAIPFPIVLALLLTAGSDSLNRFSVGGIRLSAAVAVVALWASLVSLPLLGAITRVSRWALTPASFFLGYAVARTIASGAGIDGVQNLAVIALFLCLVLHVANADAGAVRRSEAWLVRIAWLLCAVYLASVVLGGLGSELLIGRRSFALQALVLLAMLVPHLLGVPSARRLALTLVLAVAVSLSRTALVLAALTFVAGLAYLPPGGTARVTRSRLRFVVGAVVALAVVGVAVATVPVLRDRFLGGDRAQLAGGFTLNTEGRAVFWSTLSESIGASPWFGHGAGSASEQLGVQPHNDHLRVVHDYGAIGFALFLWALWRPTRACWQWFRAAGDAVTASRHAAAACALTTWSLGMLTDNPLIYSFVLAPLAVVLGASLGAATSEHGDPATAPARRPVVTPT